jgi:hypothetical protein
MTCEKHGGGKGSIMCRACDLETIEEYKNKDKDKLKQLGHLKFDGWLMIVWNGQTRFSGEIKHGEITIDDPNTQHHFNFSTNPSTHVVCSTLKHRREKDNKIDIKIQAALTELFLNEKYVFNPGCFLKMEQLNLEFSDERYDEIQLYIHQKV